MVPNISRNSEIGENGEKSHSNSKSRLLLESIISLLPMERTAVSCSFLLKLLKAANILRASSSSKTELTRRIGVQLDEATVPDLLIPCLSNDMVYDVDVILNILEQFMLQSQSPPTSPPRVKGRFERHRRSRSANNGDFELLQESRRSSSASHSSKLKVARLIDGYLKEIAKDVNLPLSKFTALAETIPEFARLDHDDLYRAIDIYLKELIYVALCPRLETIPQKRPKRGLFLLCDCESYYIRSLYCAGHIHKHSSSPGSVVADMTCPSNYFKALFATKICSRPPGSISTNRSMVQPEDQWSVSGFQSPKSNLSTLRMKLAEDDDLDENFHEGITKADSSKVKQLCSLPNRPKRMLSKLWSTNRSASEKR
ncbi:BTB/POZ domain-containing protein-like protein [Tanacetum coccineum]